MFAEKNRGVRTATTITKPWKNLVVLVVIWVVTDSAGSKTKKTPLRVSDDAVYHPVERYLRLVEGEGGLLGFLVGVAPTATSLVGTLCPQHDQ